MKIKFLSLHWALCIGILSGESSCVAETIELENKKGKKVIVELLTILEDKISVKLGNGIKLDVSMDQLSDNTVSLLEAKRENLEEAVSAGEKKINQAVGHQLFSGGQSLWTSDVKIIASNLKWPIESDTKHSSSYRKYPSASYGFLNARPYSSVIYGDKEGKVVQLSLVYANKGDYNSTVGRGQDHFKPANDIKKEITSLEDAMERDEMNISSVLTAALGDAQKQYFGEREAKTKVKRWDYRDHSFILSNVKGEYVRLLIVPQIVADAKGKEKFISDTKLRQYLLTNIETNDFGDTVVGNIPMVDQGPKGYCAPATFERAMRYMKVPADMYVLATMATSDGGGTNTRLLTEKSKNIIRSKARRIKDFDSSEISMKSIKKYVDKGVPILWCMRSLDAYNEIANSLTKERVNAKNSAAWKEKVEAQIKSKLAKLKSIKDNYHICMVIGYNEQTRELGVSDSWGPRHKLRWVHIDVINAVSEPGSFVIDL